MKFMTHRTLSRLPAGLLALALTLALTLTPACAAGTDNTAAPDPQRYAAELLYNLGLFQGVGDLPDGTPDFALTRTPNREEAVTMLVRLLGKEAEAKSGTWKTPFADVSDWAKSYVGYAYEKKLTNGISATAFGGTEPVSAAQYLTFVLRALGYDDKAGDFTWNTPWTLTDALSVTFGEYTGAAAFTRGNAATVSANALGAAVKDSGHTLLASLKEAGALGESKVVILDLEVSDRTTDRIDFVFYPLTGSPRTYPTFQVNSVRVNGLPCEITQQYYTQTEAFAQFFSLKELYPDAFNYTVLKYDEAAAKKAAVNTLNTGDALLPILVFSFDCTGTLPDGTEVPEVFTEAVYIPN
jgi:hypothetical protein